jgi:hypothetical protein
MFKVQSSMCSDKRFAGYIDEEMKDQKKVGKPGVKRLASRIFLTSDPERRAANGFAAIGSSSASRVISTTFLKR